MSYPHWRNALISPSHTLQAAIHTIDKGRAQIALVVDQNYHLLGTVTDGDIRRALLKAASMEILVETVMTTNPVSVRPFTHPNAVLGLMKRKSLHQLPILDSKNQVIGMHIWTDMPVVTHDNTVVIMAGGLGTRMGKHTKNCPKPMLKVRGKPLLQHIIEKAIANGFTSFLISLHYLPDIIMNYFADGSKWGVDIQYVCEDSPLGTVGSLSLWARKPNLPFIVTNGDVLSDVRFSEMLDFHIAHSATATMAVREHEIQNPYGVVNLSEFEITSFEEKPVYRSYINAGVYILDPIALDFLNYNERCDMPTLFECLKKGGQNTLAYPLYETWMDVGRPEDLAQAHTL